MKALWQPEHDVALLRGIDRCHGQHTCDNPRCVNPTHLVLGSQIENIADREKKGRTGVLARQTQSTKVAQHREQVA